MSNVGAPHDDIERRFIEIRPAPEHQSLHWTPIISQIDGCPIIRVLKHSLIASRAGGDSLEWRFNARLLRTQPRLSVTTNDAAIEAALRGFGITRLLSYQVAPLVAAGELKLLLEKYEPPPLPIHILRQEGRHASAKIRTFVDLMVQRLRKDLALVK